MEHANLLPFSKPVAGPYPNIRHYVSPCISFQIYFNIFPSVPRPFKFSFSFRFLHHTSTRTSLPSRAYQLRFISDYSGTLYLCYLHEVTILNDSRRQQEFVSWLSDLYRLWVFHSFLSSGYREPFYGERRESARVCHLLRRLGLRWGIAAY